ncbi:MAG: cell division ATP-binding protein FtsE [Caldisericaceae bacterium]
MIELKNIEKVYPNGTTALSKVSFSIQDGDFVILMGESGAGKTTLLKIIHGQEEPTSGSIFLDGKDLKLISKSFLRREIGFAFQDFMLIEDRTVFENVSLPLQIRGESYGALNNKVHTSLKAMKLDEKSYKLVRELSGGEKQRISIARALISNPHILILDEPTGNLDSDTAKEVISYVEAMNENGTTVIMSTHHIVEWNGRPKTVIKLKNGRILKRDYA